ncbi:MAG TPA: hypothetical protein VIX73_35600, partial [Kofleriaceae bacterium]
QFDTFTYGRDYFFGGMLRFNDEDLSALLTVGGSALSAAAIRPAPPPATGAARERIVREASRVDDDELRELIARVRITHDR